MRAREFTNESSEKLRKGAIGGLPNAKKWPELDNSSPYHAFRFSVAMAGMPGGEMPLDGPVGQKLVTVGYTDADNEIIDATGKAMGFTSEQLTGDGSDELDNVNTTSPVANWMNNSKRD